MALQSQTSVKPAVFWVLITSESAPADVGSWYTGKEDLYRNGMVAHEYTELGSQRRTGHVESILNWREKYPYLERIYSTNELNCDVIHMDVSLQLLMGYAQCGAVLITRMELSIPGREFAGHQWQIITNLVKPLELCHEDQTLDPPMQHENFDAEVVSVNDDETIVKVPFPANAWAHAFTCLTDVQMAYDSSTKAESADRSPSHALTRPTREYVDQISMYQEVHSSPGPGVHFTRRAIILWTFHKTRNGELGSTTWRNLDPHPPRRMCMSPVPHPSHHISAATNETSKSWTDPQIYLQTEDMMDPIVQGLVMLPNTSDLESPFAHSYESTSHHFDTTPENLSFISNTTMDSEDTLVGDEVNANTSGFLSNTDVNLNDFDHSSDGWNIESFDENPEWANNNVPAGIPQLGWHTDARNHDWLEISLTRQNPPAVDAYGKHDEERSDAISSPVKQNHSYIEAAIKQKLLPWIDHEGDGNSESVKDGSSKTNGVRPVDLGEAQVEHETSTTKEQEEYAWIDHDGGFDFDHLAKPLT